MQKITHTYKKVGNLKIELDVYSPDSGSKNTPIIVIIHGGCLMYAHRFGDGPENKSLAHLYQMGATVISIDYRLAPETKLPGIIEDIKDCFSWIHSEGKKIYDYDTNRVIVRGGSAGGYLTMMCGFCLKKIPQGLITYCGYGDISQEWYSQPSPAYNAMDIVSRKDSGIDITDNPETIKEYKERGVDLLYTYYRQNGLWTKEVSGVDPQVTPSFFDQYEPIKNITKNYPPSFFLHGENDPDVPCSKSVDMSEALTKAGVKNQLMIFKGGGHGFAFKNLESPQTIESIEKVKIFVKEIFEK